MNKQDDKIKQLFDDYASELAPRDDLSSKARAMMTASPAENKQSDSPRKKSSFWKHFAWIAPVASVFVIVVITLISAPFIMLGGIFNKPDTPDTPTPPTMSATSTSYYSFADVKGRSVSPDMYEEQLHISAIKEEYEVVSERYYAFFTDDGQLRYIKVLLGVRSSDGTFTEIELIAEVDGYVRNDLKESYDAGKYYDEFVYKTSHNSDDSDRGEYVTRGFFFARNMHFYVYARNGQDSTVAQEIISKIL